MDNWKIANFFKVKLKKIFLQLLYLRAVSHKFLRPKANNRQRGGKLVLKINSLVRILCIKFVTFSFIAKINLYLKAQIFYRLLSIQKKRRKNDKAYWKMHPLFIQFSCSMYCGVNDIRDKQFDRTDRLTDRKFSVSYPQTRICLGVIGVLVLNDKIGVRRKVTIMTAGTKLLEKHKRNAIRVMSPCLAAITVD